MAVLLTGLFVGGLFYLKQHSGPAPKTEDTTIAKTKETPKKSAAAAHQQHNNASNSSSTTTQQNFDFYTILPKNQMAPQQTNSNNATSTQTSSKNKANLSTTGLPTKAAYILQIGEFKGYASADELKAQVVLQGYEVNITSTNKNGAPLYYVWLGPYQTREQALQQQKNLLSNQIKSVLAPLKKTEQSQ